MAVHNDFIIIFMLFIFALLSKIKKSALISKKKLEYLV